MSRAITGLVVSVALTISSPWPAAAQGRGFPMPQRDTPLPATGTAALSGRVVALEDGRPLRRAQVQLSVDGAREPRTALTDGEGRYEFSNLVGGRYTLSARKTGYVNLSYGQRRPFEAPRPLDIPARQRLDNVDLTLPKAGVVAVRVVDQSGEPVGGINVSAFRRTYTDRGRGLLVVNTAEAPFQQTDDHGELRIFGLMPGEYYVGTRPGPGGFQGTGVRGFGFAPTFYPGTLVEADARPVSVGIGQEVQVTLMLVEARAVQVSGIVRMADGSPLMQSGVSLSQRTFSGTSGRGTQIRPDGGFTFTNVLPGEYTVEAFAGPRDLAQRLTASVPISVAGRDISGLILTLDLTRGAIRGRIEFDTGAPPANLRPATIRLTGWGTRSGYASEQVTPREDWTFEIAGLDADARILSLQSPPAPWSIKAIMLGNRDVTDTPIDVDSRLVENVRVILTDQRTEVAGTVVDAQGRPVNDFAVVVFADEERRWMLRNRYIAAARADLNGRFTVVGLPPGTYRAVALEYLERGSERDPDLLRRLRERATLITLGEGESRTMSLSLVSF